MSYDYIVGYGFMIAVMLLFATILWQAEKKYEKIIGLFLFGFWCFVCGVLVLGNLLILYGG